jgi:hypothetical protein
MVRKSRKSSPYFFRRVWSPFGHSIQAVRNTAGIALSAVDSAGKSVTGHLNDAVGNLVRPRRGGRRTQRRNKNRSNKNRSNKNRSRSNKNRSRSNKNRSRKNKNSMRH